MLYIGQPLDTIVKQLNSRFSFNFICFSDEILFHSTFNLEYTFQPRVDIPFPIEIGMFNRNVC